MKLYFQIKETFEASQKSELKNMLFEKNRVYQSSVTELEQNFPKHFQMKNDLVDFKLSAMVKTGIWLNIISIVLLSLLVYFFLGPVWGITFKGFPESFLK